MGHDRHGFDRGLAETIMKRGYVYVFSIADVRACDGHELYKIGLSRDPVVRTRTLCGLPEPIKEIHRIATNKMDWLENEFHQKYRKKRHFREWFRLDAPDLHELTGIHIRDFVPEQTLFGRFVQSIALSPRAPKSPLSATDCAACLRSHGWGVAAYPGFSPKGEAWLVVAELGQNRIAAGGKTEQDAWLHALITWSRNFGGREASAGELQFQQRGVG
jgi:hypothetical protein